MTKGKRVALKGVNPYLTCPLCEGYLVGATSLSECPHTFCKSCIVKYVETNSECPVCHSPIHERLPLSGLRSDTTMQTIVHKMVPGLQRREMKRRNAFYVQNPQGDKGSLDYRRTLSSDEEICYCPDDKFSIVLKLCAECVVDEQNVRVLTPSEIGGVKAQLAGQIMHYLQCDACVPIKVLKKFIRLKYDLTEEFEVDIFHSNEPLPDGFSLLDVAYTYTWRQMEPLKLSFSVCKFIIKRQKMEVPNSSKLRKRWKNRRKRRAATATLVSTLTARNCGTENVELQFEGPVVEMETVHQREEMLLGCDSSTETTTSILDSHASVEDSFGSSEMDCTEGVSLTSSSINMEVPTALMGNPVASEGDDTAEQSNLPMEETLNASAIDESTVRIERPVDEQTYSNCIRLQGENAFALLTETSVEEHITPSIATGVLTGVEEPLPLSSPSVMLKGEEKPVTGGSPSVLPKGKENSVTCGSTSSFSLSEGGDEDQATSSRTCFNLTEKAGEENANWSITRAVVTEKEVQVHVPPVQAHGIKAEWPPEVEKTDTAANTKSTGFEEGSQKECVVFCSTSTSLPVSSLRPFAAPVNPSEAAERIREACLCSSRVPQAGEMEMYGSASQADCVEQEPGASSSKVTKFPASDDQHVAFGSVSIDQCDSVEKESAAFSTVTSTNQCDSVEKESAAFSAVTAVNQCDSAEKETIAFSGASASRSGAEEGGPVIASSRTGTSGNEEKKLSATSDTSANLSDIEKDKSVSFSNTSANLSDIVTKHSVESSRTSSNKSDVDKGCVAFRGTGSSQIDRVGNKCEESSDTSANRSNTRTVKKYCSLWSVLYSMTHQSQLEDIPSEPTISNSINTKQPQTRKSSSVDSSCVGKEEPVESVAVHDSLKLAEFIKKEPDAPGSWNSGPQECAFNQQAVEFPAVKQEPTSICGPAALIETLPELHRDGGVSEQTSQIRKSVDDSHEGPRESEVSETLPVVEEPGFDASAQKDIEALYVNSQDTSQQISCRATRLSNVEMPVSNSVHADAEILSDTVSASASVKEEIHDCKAYNNSGTPLSPSKEKTPVSNVEVSSSNPSYADAEILSDAVSVSGCVSGQTSDNCKSCSSSNPLPPSTEIAFMTRCQEDSKSESGTIMHPDCTSESSRVLLPFADNSGSVSKSQSLGAVSNEQTSLLTTKSLDNIEIQLENGHDKIDQTLCTVARQEDKKPRVSQRPVSPLNRALTSSVDDKSQAPESNVNTSLARTEKMSQSILKSTSERAIVSQVPNFLHIPACVTTVITHTTTTSPRSVEDKSILKKHFRENFLLVSSETVKTVSKDVISDKPVQSFIQEVPASSHNKSSFLGPRNNRESASLFTESRDSIQYPSYLGTIKSNGIGNSKAKQTTLDVSISVDHQSVEYKSGQSCLAGSCFPLSQQSVGLAVSRNGMPPVVVRPSIACRSGFDRARHVHVRSASQGSVAAYLVPNVESKQTVPVHPIVAEHRAPSTRCKSAKYLASTVPPVSAVHPAFYPVSAGAQGAFSSSHSVFAIASSVQGGKDTRNIVHQVSASPKHQSQIPLNISSESYNSRPRSNSPFSSPKRQPSEKTASQNAAVNQSKKTATSQSSQPPRTVRPPYRSSTSKQPIRQKPLRPRPSTTVQDNAGSHCFSSVMPYLNNLYGQRLDIQAFSNAWQMGGQNRENAGLTYLYSPIYSPTMQFPYCPIDPSVLNSSDTPSKVARQTRGRKRVAFSHGINPSQQRSLSPEGQSVPKKTVTDREAVGPVHQVVDSDKLPPVVCATATFPEEPKNRPSHTSAHEVASVKQFSSPENTDEPLNLVVRERKGSKGEVEAADVRP